MQMASTYSLIACHDCDLLYRKHSLRHGERALCSRCGAVLYHKKPDTLDRTLLHSLTNLILFVLANVFPFMSFQLQGREQVTLLSSGGIELYHQGFWGLGFLVLAVGVLFPLLKIVGTLYVLMPLKFNRRVWKAKETFRFVEALTPWSPSLSIYVLSTSRPRAGHASDFGRNGIVPTRLLGTGLLGDCSWGLVSLTEDFGDAVCPHALEI